MSSAIPRFDIAVIGAGVAGLATALGLAQAGLTVALIGPPVRRHLPTDAAPFDARIYALAPATIALFERLKRWPQVDAARVQAVARMRVFGDAGEELTFDAYAATVERLATIAEESELLRALSLGAGATAGITRYETGMKALEADSLAARVWLDDGREIAAALVVGADGAGSPVRAAAGINAVVTPYPHTAVVCNFACGVPHGGVAWQWFTDEGVVALLPLPGDAVSLVWSAPHALAEQLQALDAQALAARVERRSGGVLGTLRAIGAAHAFPLRLLTVDRLVAPRVALVGDAAHVLHPLAGQGLNLGLQDVAALVDKLAAREPWRDCGDLVLLRRYARARAEPIALMRVTTDALARLFGVDDPLVRRLRNTGMGVVNRLRPLKTALIRHALG